MDSRKKTRVHKSLLCSLSCNSCKVAMHEGTKRYCTIKGNKWMFGCIERIALTFEGENTIMEGCSTLTQADEASPPAPMSQRWSMMDPYAGWFQKMNRGAADAPEHIRKAAHEWEKMKRARTTTHSPSSSSSSS